MLPRPFLNLEPKMTSLIYVSFMFDCPFIILVRTFPTHFDREAHIFKSFPLRNLNLSIFLIICLFHLCSIVLLFFSFVSFPFRGKCGSWNKLYLLSNFGMNIVSTAVQLCWHSFLLYFSHSSLHGKKHIVRWFPLVDVDLRKSLIVAVLHLCLIVHLFHSLGLFNPEEIERAEIILTPLFKSWTKHNSNPCALFVLGFAFIIFGCASSYTLPQGWALFWDSFSLLISTWK